MKLNVFFMLKVCLLTFWVSFVTISFAQAPTYEWVKGLTGNGSAIIRDIETDDLGNSYIGGHYSGSALILQNNSLSNSGSSDGFVAKLDSSGTVVWAKKIGGIGFERVSLIEVDNDLNVYFAGIFTSSEITINGMTITNQGLNDSFFGKYDSNGNLVYLNSIGGLGNQSIGSLAVFDTNKICIFGNFDSSNLTLGEIVLNSSSNYQFFSVLVDSDGTFYSAANHNYRIRDVQYDTQGNYYLAADFNSPQINLGGTIINNNGGYDFFIAKFDGDDNLIWVKNYGSSSDDSIWHFSLNNNGDLVLEGTFGNSSINIENTIFQPYPVFNQENNFFIKLNSNNGQIYLAKKIEVQTFGFIPNDIEVDSMGNIFISGDHSSAINLDGNVINLFCTNCFQSKLLLKYNSEGQLQWYKRNGPVNSSTGNNCLKINHMDDLFYSDIFSNSAYTSFDSFTLTAQGAFDGFYAKINHSNLNTVNLSYETSFLYPNPTNDFLYLSDTDSARSSGYEIHEITGRVILREVLGSNDKIDVSFLSKGTYLLYVGKRVYKFIKE